MYDPRWDDAREREDGRGRMYDQPDREHDPRDGLMQDLSGLRGSNPSNWLGKPFGDESESLRSAVMLEK
jgi:hypothetical protein